MNLTPEFIEAKLKDAAKGVGLVRKSTDICRAASRLRPQDPARADRMIRYADWLVEKAHRLFQSGLQ